MAYGTLAQLKSYLGVIKTSDDGILTDMLDRAMARIESHLGFGFAVTADTIVAFDYEQDLDADRLELMFHGWLAAAPTLVKNEVDGKNETIPAAEYVLLDSHLGPPYYGLRLKRGSSYAWSYAVTPEDSIKVTGKWGWSTTPPADLVHDCIRLAGFMYRQKQSGADADRAAVLADGTMVLPAQFPKDVLGNLSHYAWRGGV